MEHNILVFAVEGRLDHKGAEMFKSALMDQIESGARRVLVDFRGTTFLASMGIRALIIPSQEVTQRGGRFAVTGLSTELEKLFATAGLHQLFTVYPDVKSALADPVWQ